MAKYKAGVADGSIILSARTPKRDLEQISGLSKKERRELQRQAIMEKKKKSMVIPFKQDVCIDRSEEDEAFEARKRQRLADEEEKLSGEGDKVGSGKKEDFDSGQEVAGEREEIAGGREEAAGEAGLDWSINFDEEKIMWLAKSVVEMSRPSKIDHSSWSVL